LIQRVYSEIVVTTTKDLAVAPSALLKLRARETHLVRT